MFLQISHEGRAFVGLMVYVLLFIGGVLGVMLWRIKRSGKRRPIEFKLLRGPGETLRRRLTHFEGEGVFGMTLAAVVPLLILMPVLWLMDRYKPETVTSLSLWLGALAVLFIGGLVVVARVVSRQLHRYRDDFLGYLGERQVGEFLQPLLKKGYEVFHDMPAKEGNAAFNLDHVVVGPSGVAAIETKTRRKGGARSGEADYKVTSDGETLKWPTGQESASLQQAIRQAQWLERFIAKRTGIQTAVRPILALPGWWVNETARRAVAVVNPKSIVSAVEGRNATPLLTAAQIDLIARQLDECCRDVVD